jgi:phosphatidylglycerophosphate synthase
MPAANRVVSGGKLRRLQAPTPIEDDHGNLMSCYHRARVQRSGGDLFSRLVNDRLGSWVAAVAIRLGIHPGVVSLVNLVLALGASVVVIATAGQAQGLWVPGLVALVGWQLAYVFDCADGQIARATGTRSDFGARLDLLVDFAVQSSIICALVTVIARWSDPPVVLLAASSTLWFVNLFVVVLARADGNIGHSFTNQRGVVDIIKLARDTGFLLFFIGGWLLVSPRNVIVPVVVITVVNATFLLASIGREAWLSMRRA